MRLQAPHSQSPGRSPRSPCWCLSLAPPQIQKIIETLTQQLQAKGKELNEFREKHNIRLVGEDEKPAKESAEGTGAKASSAGVLVS